MKAPSGPRVRPLENPALTRDLVEWVLSGPRTYAQVMEAWRTSCPRFPIWEDAVDHGFVRVHREPGGTGLLVSVTPAGRTFLDAGS